MAVTLSFLFLEDKVALKRKWSACLGRRLLAGLCLFPGTGLVVGFEILPLFTRFSLFMDWLTMFKQAETLLTFDLWYGFLQISLGLFGQVICLFVEAKRFPQQDI